MGGRGGNSGLSSQSTQEKLFEREREISARKKELNDILRDSDEWSIRNPSPEIAAEQKKLNAELEEIKEKRRNLPNLTFYVVNTETEKIEKVTVDNKGSHHYSPEIRAIAKATGKVDEIALDYSQSGKVKSFESKKQAENYTKSTNRKVTAEDGERWRKKVRRAQRMITYDNF